MEILNYQSSDWNSMSKEDKEVSEVFVVQSIEVGSSIKEGKETIPCRFPSMASTKVRDISPSDY